MSMICLFYFINEDSIGGDIIVELNPLQKVKLSYAIEYPPNPQKDRPACSLKKKLSITSTTPIRKRKRKRRQIIKKEKKEKKSM